MKLLIRWLIVFMLPLSMLIACEDEDKTGCRTDGDCAGIRICESGTCTTPAEFRDTGLGQSQSEDSGQGEETQDLGSNVDAGGGG